MFQAVLLVNDRCAFFQSGVEGLKLAYKGSQGKLTLEQRTQIIEWLRTKDRWTLNELEYEVTRKYGVVFDSKQSYYDLFNAARISWKKTQASNPKHNKRVSSSKKKEICTLLEGRRAEIESGRLVVFMIDECHLLWGDVCGYVWGKTSERVLVQIVNERSKQTYFGALDYKTKEFLTYKAEKANSETTMRVFRISSISTSGCKDSNHLGRCQLSSVTKNKRLFRLFKW